MSSGFGGSDLNQLKDKDDIEDDDDRVNLVYIYSHFSRFPLPLSFLPSSTTSKARAVRGTFKLISPRLAIQAMLH